ncbi:MAG: bifunctional phosphoglucose/phosphomannose isomerase [Candidatus ainarchaeum sp.]|nr:bifunctional phosphoglucose/phosphomannose isomerase [Candidatus ainarchaeum sp.]
MDWAKLQKKFDKKNVLQIMLDYPSQIRQGIEIGKKFSCPAGEFSDIVFCGMGGSGMAGLIVKQAVFNEIQVPVEVIEDYSLPAYVDEKTLVIAVSFSGNTEETVACFEEAKRKNAGLIVVASSGLLAEEADAKIIVPSLPQPRLGAIVMAVPVFFALEKLGFIREKEKELSDCFGFLEDSKNSMNAEAKKIALKLKGKFPVIQAPADFGVLSCRMRLELNENSKVLALSNVLPEMNHNEINSEILPKNSFFVFFRDNGENAQMKKRFAFTQKVFKKFPREEILLKGKNKIEKLFYGILISALVSYYLALLNGKDPNEIPIIGELKKELKK